MFFTLTESANITVKIPTLPKNIRVDRSQSEKAESVGVIPTVSPTVPAAENASKSAETNGTPSTSEITVPESRIIKSIVIKSPAACKTIEEETVFLPIVTFFLPKSAERAAKTRSAAVETFIPPAVEPEPPPINIIIIATASVAVFSAEKSKVANPAVRSVAEKNTESRTFSPAVFPERKAPFSRRRNATAAKTKTADILRYGESCRRSLHG